MNFDLDSLLGLLPDKFRSSLAPLILLAMVIGRVWHAYRTGGDLSSALAGIFKGTNAPSSAEAPRAQFGIPVLPASDGGAPSTAHLSAPPVLPDAGGQKNPPTQQP